MSFSGEVQAEWLPDGETMRLLSPLRYTDHAGRVWTAPAGFVTDGASIPRALWIIVGAPFNGKYREAAVLHDAAYRTLGVTKEDADNMLWEASIELGCEEWLADLIYEGVRVGGVDAYAEDQTGNISPN
jgi:hypothetical protein